MRILYATHGYKPAYRVGGPILSVAAVAEELVRRGHEVTVFTTNSNLDQDLDVPTDRPIDVNGVSVWYFQRTRPLAGTLPAIPYLSRSIGFLYAPAMRAALDDVVPGTDIVHTHIPFVYPTYAAARAATRHGVPLFYNQRGVFDPARLRYRTIKKRLFIQFVERRTLRAATALIALTPAEVDSYRALGVRTPCAVVPNGIDVSEYRTRPKSDPLAQFGVPADAPVLLFLSRVHPIKGADVLLDAFLRLRRECPDLVFVIAGPDECGLEQQFLRAAATTDARVVFTGMVEGERKLDLLARADLLCLPSVAEGFSMAVLEALASGTPVAISSGCHFAEVEDHRAGAVVPRDPVGLTTALRTLFADPHRLREMGESGRRLVAECYTWPAITDRLLDLYRHASDKRARRAA